MPVKPEDVGRVWAVVPARRGARRLPNKPLADLGGEPLVAHVLRKVVGSGCFSEVVLATDDDTIAAVGRQAGVRVVMTGPAPSGTHRCAAAVEALVSAGLPPPEQVVNVQGDQPLLDPAHLVALQPAIREVATLAAPLVGDPADPRRVKVVCDDDGRALYFSRAPVPWGGPYRVHVGVYGFTADALRRCVAAPRGAACVGEDLEQLAWLAAGIRIDVVGVATVEHPVDDVADLARVQAAIEARRNGDG